MNRWQVNRALGRHERTVGDLTLIVTHWRSRLTDRDREWSWAVLDADGEVVDGGWALTWRAARQAAEAAA